jgi:hypothetical protein
MIVAHRRHIIASVALSAAMYFALILIQYLGIGGIQIHPWPLFAGFVLAEGGRTLMYFGERSNRSRTEYFGVFLQGLAWWVWCMNFGFLDGKQGASFWLHFLLPGFVLGTLPVVAHYARKETGEYLKDVEASRNGDTTDAPADSSSGAPGQ